MSDQDKVFFEFEGDNWFNRNRSALGTSAKIGHDAALTILEKHPDISRKRVLEIGCSNGWRLAEIHRRYGSHCVGVEPSPEAIREGSLAYPGIRLQRGTAAHLDLDEGESFDLVIVNFVLHWVSRESLLRAVAEIDRVIAAGGHLLLGDFFPDRPERRGYHHVKTEQLYTFKQDYAQIFLASNLYTLEDRILYDHDQPGRSEDIPSGSRAVCSALRKHLESCYAES